MARRAVRACRRRRRLQVGDHRSDTRLGRVGAVAVAAARVAVLAVVVVGSRLGIGVLDLVCRRSERVALAVREVDVVGAAQHHVVDAGAALCRLVVVVGQRVLVRPLLQEGGVAAADVVVAHGQAALVDGRRRVGAAVALPGRVGDPDEEVVPPAIGLLRHLIEAVNRVTDEVGRVGHVLGDLERRVGQVGREPRVGRVEGRKGARRVGLGQGRVRPRRVGGQRVGRRVAGRVLDCPRHVRPRRPVGGDDPLGEQVLHLLPRLRHVGGEDVVEGVVLPDDHDHVLDRGGGGPRRALGKTWSAGHAAKGQGHGCRYRQSRKSQDLSSRTCS